MLLSFGLVMALQDDTRMETASLDELVWSASAGQSGWDINGVSFDLTLTGFAQAENHSLGLVRADDPNPALDLKGRYTPRIQGQAMGATGSRRRRSRPTQGKNKPTLGGSNRRDPRCVARWARHAV